LNEYKYSLYLYKLKEKGVDMFKQVFRYLKSVQEALLYESGKLSSGRLMMHFTFLILNVFWITNLFHVVDVPASLENVLYALLAYVLGTKGVTTARTVIANKATPPPPSATAKAVAEQKTTHVDSPD
jgi:hypothetical protein